MPTGAYSCPIDTGSSVLAIFSYIGAQDDVVAVELTGCQTVTNGRLVRWAVYDQRLLHRLEKLTR